jgi:hypothetical protein
VANHRVKMPDLEAIVDGKGYIIGLSSSQGEVYFGRVLDSSGVSKQITGTSQQSLMSVTVPGGAMGTNGQLRISAQLSVTNNANAKSLGVYANGTLIGTAYALASMAGFAMTMSLRNRGSQNAQVAQMLPNGSSATVTAAIDFSQDVAIELRMTQATGSDTTTLEGYTLEIMPDM